MYQIKFDVYVLTNVRAVTPHGLFSMTQLFLPLPIQQVLVFTKYLGNSEASLPAHLQCDQSSYSCGQSLPVN